VVDEDELLVEDESLLSSLLSTFRAPPRRIETFCGAVLRTSRGDRLVLVLCDGGRFIFFLFWDECSLEGAEGDRRYA